MAKTQPLNIKNLNLDLKNFRTIPQKDEESALYAMITVAPDRFWALCESLLESGYLPTENIIVLKTERGELIVKEGNRRIGALKIIFGYLEITGIPNEVLRRIEVVDEVWRKSNLEVPCAIYDHTEEALVDKIVSLAHGKGEKAGKDNWTSIARARHNRDKSGASEVGLDLLEKYLKHGRNLTVTDGERWSGDYPLAILDETIRRLSKRIGYSSSKDLVKRYPSISYRKEIEQILNDIGSGKITFEIIRDLNKDFGTTYGLPLGKSSKAGLKKASKGKNNSRNPKAISANDPRSVVRILKAFSPRGKRREKVVTLLNEIRLLKINKHPHAFCFLLRAMFELSAKAYCADNSLSIYKKDGSDKKLADVLSEITKDITNGKKQTDPLCRSLYAAMTELKKKNGLLSVTSMNQLIHNPNFIVDDSHISTVFSNVYPLLVEMNR